MDGLHLKHKNSRLFDDWPQKYDQWFTTPIGSLVKKYEGELVIELLRPSQGEIILDAGCGTGVFTLDILSLGAHVIGLDISLPMLKWAAEKVNPVRNSSGVLAALSRRRSGLNPAGIILKSNPAAADGPEGLWPVGSKRGIISNGVKRQPFQIVLADMLNLPFQKNSFDKVVSVTALEFIKDAKEAVRELFRVTKRDGIIVVATLNSLSPWASLRKAQAKRGHAIFKEAIFRSPDEMRSLAPVNGMIKTAIHFEKDDEPDHVPEIEHEGQRNGLKTGAFLTACWEKP